MDMTEDSPLPWLDHLTTQMMAALPCIFFLICSPIYLIFLTRRKWAIQNNYSTIYFIKQGICMVLLIYTCMDVFCAVNLNVYAMTTIDVYTLITASSLVMALVCVEQERKYNTSNSGLMFFFWCGNTIACGIPIMWQRSSTDSPNVAAISTWFILSLFEAFVSNMAAPYTKSKQDYECSVVSRLLLDQGDRVVKEGFKAPITFDKLFTVHDGLKVAHNALKFEKSWNSLLLNKSHYSHWKSSQRKLQTKRNSHGSFFRTIIHAWKKYLIYDIFIQFMDILLRSTQPMLLSFLIKYFDDKDSTISFGVVLCIMILVSENLLTLLDTHKWDVDVNIGLKIKMAAHAAIYKKSLRLSNASRKQFSKGEIASLLGEHCGTLFFAPRQAFKLLLCPVKISISLYILYQLLGLSSLIGVAVLCVTSPLHFYIGTMVKKIEGDCVIYRDQAMKMLNEVLNGIKVLKLYAWELSFEKYLKEIRLKEMDSLKRKTNYRVLAELIYDFTTFPAMVAIFAVYLLSNDDHTLSIQKIFVSLATFYAIKDEVVFIPHVVAYLIKVKVSIEKFTHFLNQEEINDSQIESCDVYKTVKLVNATFCWEREEEEKSTLKDMSFEAQSGCLTAVVGSVGSGKSSLLSAILGEMEKLSGKAYVNGTIAYVAQQAWIQNISVKDNILFGKLYDKDKYEKVLAACELKKDLDMWPCRDDTLVGEKGVILSGGQKQRISLARAVYHDADIYLLDDTLSAVDAHTGKNIFQQVISRETGMLKDKTCILVTNAIHYLHHAHQILVLNEGQITERGTYQQLMTQKTNFAKFIRNYILERVSHNSIEDLDEEEQSLIEEYVKSNSCSQEDKTLSLVLPTTATSDVSKSVNDFKPHSFKRPDLQRTFSTPACSNNSEEKRDSSKPFAHRGIFRQISCPLHETWTDDGTGNQSPKENHSQEGNQLIQDEKILTGKVKLEVLASYFKSYGLMLPLLVLGMAAKLTTEMASNMHLKNWEETSTDSAAQNDSQANAHNFHFLKIYILLGLLHTFCQQLSNIGFAFGQRRASLKFHHDLLHNLMRSSLAFFEKTPIGRITHVFSSDVGKIDNQCSNCSRDCFYKAMQFIVTTSVICYAMPPFALVLVLALMCMYNVMKYFSETYRQLRRLHSAKEASVHSHFEETLHGISTIRAYSCQEQFVKQFYKAVDDSDQGIHNMRAVDRWREIRIGFIGSTMVLFVAFIAVFNKSSIGGATVALAVLYAFEIRDIFNLFLYQAANLESSIVSLEKVLHYSNPQVTEKEAEWIIEKRRPRNGWPEKGNIRLQDYGLKFRKHLPLFIKSLNCEIHAGEKVGIVGHTGAGKSTLTSALFRMIEAAEGSIVIDDIDISTIGLYDLRSKVAIIPQDPVLFAGKLRMNLDPLEEYTDMELSTALEHAHLKAFVDTCGNGLDFECSEGGSNLSVGQKQLICLARALLRKAKVIVLDEATASVDLKTDDLIQATIREEFSQCTVLTIAHRLNTIMDYDRVMVMDKGKIAEFASPQLLLNNKESIFYKLAYHAKLVK